MDDQSIEEQRVCYVGSEDKDMRLEMGGDLETCFGGKHLGRSDFE